LFELDQLDRSLISGWEDKPDAFYRIGHFLFAVQKWSQARQSGKTGRLTRRHINSRCIRAEIQ